MTRVVDAESPSELWHLFDELRGELSPHDLPVTIAALFYLRWADFQAAEQEAIAAFDEEDYTPVLPASMHWRSWHTLPPNELRSFLAHRLPAALQQFGNARHDSIATQLHRIAPAVENLGRLPEQALSALVRWLEAQNFETPNDRLSLLKVFDKIVGRARKRSHHGEHTTPDSIARLMVELANPAPGDRVYDPCFGSAGLLIAAYEFVREREKARFSRNGSSILDIAGVEINSDAYVIGLTRLALAGVDEPQLELGNSLERAASDNPQRDGVDVVLANPPWGMRVDSDGLFHFPVRTTDATGLFIQHALSQLRPEGRAIVVVPAGFLFRGGAQQRLRRVLIEQHAVDTVISLPETTFLPHTAIGASILVLRRKGPTRRIRMVDGAPYFEKSKGRHPSELRQGAIKELVESIRRPDAEHGWDVEADSLSELEWDFTPKRRDRSGLSRILGSLAVETDIVALNSCCMILSGKSVKSDQLLDAPPPGFEEQPEQVSLFPDRQMQANQSSLFEFPRIAYIRIRDIQNGQATKGTSWLSAEAAAGVDSRLKLKNGDVLISKSGTIGKSGVVRNGAVGGIAANGLVVLRPQQDKLDPHFLSAYINSVESREWLDDRARGATIRHLSKRILNDMPVPLPPLQIQQRVAAKHREHGVDALAMVAELLSDGADDPVSAWTDAALRRLKQDTHTNSEGFDVSPLLHAHVLGDGLTELRNRLSHGHGSDSLLSSWALAIHRVADSLRDAEDIPGGPSLYSVLQHAAHGFSEALASIVGNLPSDSNARDLTGLLMDRVESAISFLAHKIDVTVSCTRNALKPGQLANVDLNVTNHGYLPLRDVVVSTRPEWGKLHIGFVAEGASKTVAVSGLTPKQVDSFSLQVDWSGRAFDGRGVEGGVEVAFDLVEGDELEKPTGAAFGGSPYVCGDPVRPERNDVFFGREELLAQIRRQVSETGNVVLLEGNRRSGKSSILWHLAGANRVPGWLGVYCSLQGAEGSKDRVGVPTEEIFRVMAISIAKAIQGLSGETPLPNGQVLPRGKKLGIAKACREGISEEAAFSDFRDYAEVVLDVLAEHKLGLLLMLDEFDKLQEGIDSGVTSPQVPENIRYLVQTYPRFSAILTGSRRLKRLREEYWSALYGLGTRFGVTSLPEGPARRLINEPVKGRITYSGEATERAIHLTAGQPYLLQCLCNRVFDMAAQLKARSITLDLVNRAGNALVEDNEHFASLWDYARSDRRRLILAICSKETQDANPLRLRVFQEILFKYGIEVDEEALIADLEFLRELELLELIGESSGGHYVLAIPLMGIWIERQHDFEAVLGKARSETEDRHE